MVNGYRRSEAGKGPSGCAVTDRSARTVKNPFAYHQTADQWSAGNLELKQGSHRGMPVYPNFEAAEVSTDAHRSGVGYELPT